MLRPRRAHSQVQVVAVVVLDKGTLKRPEVRAPMPRRNPRGLESRLDDLSAKRAASPRYSLLPVGATSFAFRHNENCCLHDHSLDARVSGCEFVGLANDQSMTATDSLFALFEHAPAVQSLRQRVEKGGVFSCAAVAANAHPFLAVLVRRLFPGRTV